MATLTAALLAIGAGFINAVSALLQRSAAGSPEAHELFSKNFMVTVSKNRVWLWGISLQLAVGGLEAAALYSGTLVLVEPLLTTDLVFLLLILHFRLRIKAGPREWLAVLAICAGLSSMLVAANPHGGQVKYDGLDWFITSAIVTGLMVVGIAITRRMRSSRVRAVVASATAGLSFGLTAALTKLVMEQLHTSVGTIFTGWALYALLASAAVSLLSAQSAYGAGPLAVSQPTIELCDPIVGVIIGIILFGDVISTHIGALFFEVIGAVLATTGIITMSTSKRILATHTELKV
ncbi:MAG TPA: DMT family transporter [Candidatus Saccharimonadales bacterium]|nr:DMT family transporter [Candidatus Saccharimonadales bacterium]